MPEDKVIKSGQLTWSRIFFFIASGVAVYVIIQFGLLNIGYLLLTAVLCGLLVLVAIDYGVSIEKVDLSSDPSQAAAAAQALTLPQEKASTAAARVQPARRRTSRVAKRRR